MKFFVLTLMTVAVASSVLAVPNGANLRAKRDHSSQTYETTTDPPNSTSSTPSSTIPVSSSPSSINYTSGSSPNPSPSSSSPSPSTLASSSTSVSTASPSTSVSTSSASSTTQKNNYIGLPNDNLYRLQVSTGGYGDSLDLVCRAPNGSDFAGLEFDELYDVRFFSSDCGEDVQITISVEIEEAPEITTLPTTTTTEHVRHAEREVIINAAGLNDLFQQVDLDLQADGL